MKDNYYYSMYYRCSIKSNKIIENIACYSILYTVLEYAYWIAIDTSMTLLE